MPSGCPWRRSPPLATTLRAIRHRGDVRRLEQGLTLIDDCYNSSPDALDAALVALSLAGPRRRVAILGDMLELGPTAPELHRAAGARAARSADLLVAVGSLAQGFLEGARGAGMPESALRSFPDATAADRGRRSSWPRRRGPGQGLAGSASRIGRGRDRGPLRRGGGLMLFHLLYALRHDVSGLNVVRYITFRTAVASLTALFLVLVLGPWMIERLRTPAGRAVHPRRRPEDPQGEGRHPHHGRGLDPGRDPHPDPALGRPHQPQRPHRRCSPPSPSARSASPTTT